MQPRSRSLDPGSEGSLRTTPLPIHADRPIDNYCPKRMFVTQARSADILYLPRLFAVARTPRLPALQGGFVSWHFALHLSFRRPSPSTNQCIRRRYSSPGQPTRRTPRAPICHKSRNLDAVCQQPWRLSAAASVRSSGNEAFNLLHVRGSSDSATITGTAIIAASLRPRVIRLV